MTTIGQQLGWAATRFALAGIPTSHLDAEVLLAHILERDRLQLVADPQLPLTPGQLTHFQQLVRRRLGREPIAYVTGRREFWSLEFQVNGAVLIPRPETETLVEEAIATCRHLHRELAVAGVAGGVSGAKGFSVLDLGTGCGNIAISLAREMEACRVTATDCSATALRIARENARQHGVATAIDFRQGDLFVALPPTAHRHYDLILSNPPYIPTSALAHLPPEVVWYEPWLALNGGASGLEVIAAIVVGAPTHLREGGYLLLEIGYGQGEQVNTMLARQGSYVAIEGIRDYSGRIRVVKACCRHQL